MKEGTNKQLLFFCSVSFSPGTSTHSPESGPPVAYGHVKQQEKEKREKQDRESDGPRCTQPDTEHRGAACVTILKGLDLKRGKECTVLHTR